MSEVGRRKSGDGSPETEDRRPKTKVEKVKNVKANNKNIKLNYDASDYGLPTSDLKPTF